MTSLLPRNFFNPLVPRCVFHSAEHQVLRVHGSVNHEFAIPGAKETPSIFSLSLQLSVPPPSARFPSIERYELSEDTLAQICEANNWAPAFRVANRVEVSQRWWLHRGSSRWRTTGRRAGAGGGYITASVAGASNYSAINNPRVTRVIGPLSR